MDREQFEMDEMYALTARAPTPELNRALREGRRIRLSSDTDKAEFLLKESKMQNHVETLALAWAEQDGLESWMLAAPDARPLSPATLREIVWDYLASHEPFPDGTRVEVARRDGSGWDPAVIIERAGTDEWTVEYDDGAQAWRDHSELRPRQ